MTGTASPVLAAGAVCWRLVDGKPRILLVHRGDRADVSLPKGKLDPGETLPQTAQREIEEETGLRVTLGAKLDVVEYPLPNGRPKVVHYWTAEVDEHVLELATFTPNNEIAALEWAPIEKARKKLSFPHDVALIDKFAARFAAGNARTFAIIALRHGKAVAPDAWDGPDATRPLMQRGHDQATSVAPAIAAFSPRKLIASTAVRCLATIAPLAGYIGLEVRPSAAISQDAYEDGQSDVPAVVAKRLAKKRTTVLCSHGPVLPEILAEIGRQTHTLPTAELRHAASLGTGDYAVVHISLGLPGKAGAGSIVAIETHSPAVAR